MSSRDIGGADNVDPLRQTDLHPMRAVDGSKIHNLPHCNFAGNQESPSLTLPMTISSSCLPQNETYCLQSNKSFGLGENYARSESFKTPERLYDKMETAQTIDNSEIETAPTIEDSIDSSMDSGKKNPILKDKETRFNEGTVNKVQTNDQVAVLKAQTTIMTEKERDGEIGKENKVDEEQKEEEEEGEEEEEEEKEEEDQNHLLNRI